MPGYALRGQAGRELPRTSGMIVQPVLDRPGELRHQIGGDDEIDGRVGDQVGQRIDTFALFFGKPAHEAGEVAGQERDLGP